MCLFEAIRSHKCKVVICQTVTVPTILGIRPGILPNGHFYEACKNIQNPILLSCCLGKRDDVQQSRESDNTQGSTAEVMEIGTGEAQQGPPEKRFCTRSSVGMEANGAHPAHIAGDMINLRYSSGEACGRTQ